MLDWLELIALIVLLIYGLLTAAFSIACYKYCKLQTDEMEELYSRVERLEKR